MTQSPSSAPKNPGTNFANLLYPAMFRGTIYRFFDTPERAAMKATCKFFNRHIPPVTPTTPIDLLKFEVWDLTNEIDKSDRKHRKLTRLTAFYLKTKEEGIMTRLAMQITPTDAQESIDQETAPVRSIFEPILEDQSKKLDALKSKKSNTLYILNLTK